MRTHVASLRKNFGLSLLAAIAFAATVAEAAVPQLPTYAESVAMVGPRRFEVGTRAGDPRPYIFDFSADRSLQQTINHTNLRKWAYNARMSKAIELGYKQINRTWGSDSPKEMVLLAVDDYFETDFVKDFTYALARHKLRIMREMEVSNEEYNRLAILAFGIAGNESKWGRSWKYFYKEECQRCVNREKYIRDEMRAGRMTTAGKWLERRKHITDYLGWTGEQLDDNYDNSRGPTQIKDIPPEILRIFPQISDNSLHYPQHAAVATVGFLAARLKEMKIRVATNRDKPKNYNYINQENVYDYLMYVYMGSADELFNGTATPALNTYIAGNQAKGIRGVKDHIRFLNLLELDSAAR